MYARRVGSSWSVLRMAWCLPMVWACGDGPPPSDGAEPGPPPATDVPSVTVFYTRDEVPVPVDRPVPSPASPEAALQVLMEGPTRAEAASGLTSWFGPDTADRLRSVTLDDDGRLVVDFHDLRGAIPNASSSAGSAMLLAELDSTVFRHPQVREVEYRMDGSCEMFWNWLQYECRVVTRSP